MNRRGARAFASLLLASAPFGAETARASSFNLTSNSTAAQTLGSASGDTGAIASGVTLTVSGSTVAVTISGNNATLTNLGTINQTGTGRVIRDNTGVSSLVVNNGSTTNSTALMQSADADVIQMNKTPASVTLNNYGIMKSLNASGAGSQAVDFTAITQGVNLINNYSGALMRAYEADAVRPGVNGTVYNAGTMYSTTTTGSSSDGVDAQNNSGVTITNDTTGLIDGARHGITGGALNSTVTFTTTVTNNAGGIIRGNNGSGINLDGFNAMQTATITNAGTISGNGVTGDGDGIDVDGLVNIINTGTIQSVNAFSPAGSPAAQSEGITVGGGTITNSGTIKGLVATGNTNAVGRGISLLGNDVTTGPLAGTREAIYGNATVTNQNGGLIYGQTDSGIAVDGPASGFTVTINNNAGGTIRGGGASTAAILTGADNDIINNSGTIDGSSSGVAINMGAGNNTLSITGGSASVSGSINGGTGGTNTLNIDPGAGNNFAFDASIMNFNVVEIYSGMVTLSGVSTYTGTTKLTGGTLDLNGANRLTGTGNLNLNGGTLETANAGGANGESFGCLALSGNSAIDLESSSISFNCLGTVAAGRTLTVTNYSSSVSPDYAFRFFGNLSTNAGFQTLLGETTVNGYAAIYHYDGTYTDVTASPEPSAFALLSLGGLLVLLTRRASSSCRS